MKELIQWDSPLLPHNIKENSSMIAVYPAWKHYDLLATAEPDPPILRRYMAQWNGDSFFSELRKSSGPHFLEVGIGLGRVAETVLAVGGSVTGLDPSRVSIDCAKVSLSKYAENLRLIHGCIDEFTAREEFDAAYSVLTFCHIKDKYKALNHMVDSVKKGGRIVLSIEWPDQNYQECTWVDQNTRYKQEYWPNQPEDIVSMLEQLNCRIECNVNLLRTIPSEASNPIGEPISTLISAVKND